MNRHLHRLEFDRIKEELKKFAHSEATKERIEALEPLKNKEEVEDLIKTFQEFSEVESLPLYNFDDIRKYLKRAKIEGATLGIEEILSILNFLKLVREVRKVIGKYAERKEKLRKFSRRLYLFSSLETLIEGSIDRRGFVKDEASEELLRIRRSIRNLEKEIMKRLENLFKNPEADRIFSDKIITIRNNRYVVPVKTSQAKKIFGIVHGTSSSGYTTYIEPQFVIQLNNKLSELKGEEEEEVRKILRRITAYIGDFANKIEESFEAVVELDLLNAKKELGKLYEGKFPKIGEYVELINARHPILALTKEDVVPVNIVLKEKKGLILTGPNTGGKTVALKTLGLISVMVQCGIPVPVSEDSTIRVFKNVFVDIGDEQSITQNLSTFSSHMVNIASFLKDVDESSLVLLDELGSGTDPAEGSSLGIGILEYLKQKGAWIFANTHHTPVKIYALNSDYFVPASVLFDEETLKPLYKIVYNTIGESKAFEVAKRCGIPEEIIENAKRYIGDMSKEYASAMEKLSEYTREYERKLQEIEELKKKLEEEKEKYEKLKEEYEEIKRRSWKEVYKEAKNYLRKLMYEAEEVLKRAKSVEEVKEFIKEKEKQLKLFEEEKEEIKEGDLVEFLGKKGKVIKKKNGKVFVAIEGKRLWIDEGSLKKVKQEAKERGVREEIPIKKTKSEINLIGLDADTAVIELEKFIEEAYAEGLKTVKIIHGVGKGVLKKAVHDFLSKCEKVRFFREAYPKEGGAGVTVVYFEGNDVNY